MFRCAVRNPRLVKLPSLAHKSSYYTSHTSFCLVFHQPQPMASAAAASAASNQPSGGLQRFAAAKEAIHAAFVAFGCVFWLASCLSLTLPRPASPCAPLALQREPARGHSVCCCGLALDGRCRAAGRGDRRNCRPPGTEQMCLIVIIR